MRPNHLRRGTAVGTVLALVLSLTHVGVAHAAESTEIEKGNAAAILGVMPDAEMLRMSDRDYTSAMYRAADNLDKPRPAAPEFQRVKQTAIDALLAQTAGETTCAPCTRYIQTGMAAAKREDDALVTERRTQQEKDRKAKVAAAAEIGLPEDRYTPELGRSVFDFIVFLELNAHPTKDAAVRQAARDALNGNSDKQWSYLTVEIFNAHRNDVVRQIQEDNTRDEQKKAADIAEQKKATAAYQSLGIIIDEATRKLSDDDFVRTIYRLSPKDSEVFLAAREAVLSLDPADRTRFIESGAGEARQRDFTNELRRRDEDRARQITVIRDAAARSLLLLELVKAANAALNGSSKDRVDFLLNGKDEHRTQSLRIDNDEIDDLYLVEGSGGQVETKPWAPGPLPAVAWKVEPGLADPSCASFSSTSRPNHYLRYTNKNRVDPIDGTSAFAKSATWCASGTLSGEIVLEQFQTGHDLEIIVGPDERWIWTVQSPAPPLPIDRRYAEDGYLHEEVGQPTGSAVIKPNGEGYRQHQGGRMYQASTPTGFKTTYVLGDFYRRYEALGFENGVLGYPIDDDDIGGKGRIAYQLFSTGGLYAVREVGDFTLQGEIYHKYTEAFAHLGPLGMPASSTTRLPDGIGWSATFEFGSIYHHPSTGTRIVLRKSRDHYVSIGAERSWLGYPTSDTTELSRGERNTFQNGRIDTSKDTGVAVSYQPVSPPAQSVEIRMGRDPMCVQVAGVGADAQKNGAGIEMWQCVQGAPKQIWDVIPVGDRVFELRNRNSGKCLDYTTVSDPESKSLEQWTCGLSSQRWEFTTTPGGSAYALRSVFSGKVIEALGSTNGALVESRADAATANQRWRLNPK